MAARREAANRRASAGASAPVPRARDDRRRAARRHQKMPGLPSSRRRWQRDVQLAQFAGGEARQVLHRFQEAVHSRAERRPSVRTRNFLM
jgi:hypothetical protein